MPRPRRLSAPSKIVTPPKMAGRNSPRPVSVGSKGCGIEPLTSRSDTLIDKALSADVAVPSASQDGHDKTSKPHMLETDVNTTIKTNMEGVSFEDEVTRATVFHSRIHLDYRERANN